MHPSINPCLLVKQAIYQCKSLDSLSKIHTHLILNGMIQANPITLQTITLYISFHLPNLAISLFHSIPSTTSSSSIPLPFLNLVLRRLSDSSFHSHLLSLFRSQSHSTAALADNFTFPFLLKAAAALCLPSSVGKEIHSAVLRSGHSGNLIVQTALLDMYAKSGLVSHSTAVFNRFILSIDPGPDLVSFNSLIHAYSLNGLHREALLAFRSMQLHHSLRPNASNLISLLSSPSPSSTLATTLHSFALKSGALCDLALASALLTAYADGACDLTAASGVFDEIEAKDSVSWNAMISACSRSGRPREAVEVFTSMCAHGARPNLVTMVSALQSCGELSSVCCGELMHGLAIKLALTELVSVAACLVSMYAKLSDLASAHRLFDELPDRNLRLYNSMASAYVLNDQPAMGLATFRDMQLDGLSPDSISLVSAVSGCSGCRDLSTGKCIHAYSLRGGFDSNTNVMNALLALYSDCGRFEDAFKLFHQMEARNLISWNTLISGYAKRGDTLSCSDLFRRMRRQEEEEGGGGGIQFDLITMLSILPSINHPEDLGLGMSFHALIIRSGFESDVSLSNALVTMYANCGNTQSAQLLFDALSTRRTVVSWNALMTGLRNCGELSVVWSLFGRMMGEGLCKPNSVTLLNMLLSCETKSQGKSVHAFAIRRNLELESSLLTSILSMYARFHDSTSSRRLFKSMDKSNVVSWNAMMSVYTQNEDAGSAVTTFKELLEFGGAELDSVTILTLSSACAQLGNAATLAQSITGFTVRKGLDRTTAVINSLIDMNARCGGLQLARELFTELKSKDSITWSSMINAYGMHGDGEAALHLFEVMQETGVRPDSISFVSVLSACSHAGMVEEGRTLFESMTKVHGISPRLKHYACVVDLLGRAGHLEEAYEIVRRLLLLLLLHGKPCAHQMLESLLGACRSHGDAKMGEKVGKLVLELNPSSATSHVMLSNIYATAERWPDSGRLRWDMDARGLKKDPGFALVELK